jgi:hypothetical protein
MIVLQGVFVAGIALYYLFTFIDSIPFLDKILSFVGKAVEPIKALRIPLIAVGAMGIGYKHAENDWEMRFKDLEVKAAQLEADNARLEAKGEQITIQYVTKYVDRIKIVKEKGDEIIVKVPVYINEKSDDGCVVNHGFRVLHDSAATNTPEVPNTTGPSYEDPTNLKLSTIGTTVGQNYKTYHEVREQLIQLQDWIKDQVVLFNTVDQLK